MNKDSSMSAYERKARHKKTKKTRIFEISTTNTCVWVCVFAWSGIEILQLHLSVDCNSSKMTTKSKAKIFAIAKIRIHSYSLNALLWKTLQKFKSRIRGYTNALLHWFTLYLSAYSYIYEYMRMLMVLGMWVCVCVYVDRISATALRSYKLWWVWVL